jgi:hypothetical protein
MIDPKMLTVSERRALGIIHDFQPSRNAGGYGRPVIGLIKLKLAQRMIEAGLARLDFSRTGVRLMLTGAGQNTHAVMKQRKERASA